MWRGQGWALASCVWPQVWLLRWVRHGSQFALGVASELGCSLWHASLQGCAWPSGFPPGRNLGWKACGKLPTLPESYISHLTLSPQFWAGSQLQWFHCSGWSISNNPDIHCGSAISCTKKPSPCPGAPPVNPSDRIPSFSQCPLFFLRTGTTQPGWGPTAFIFGG